MGRVNLNDVDNYKSNAGASFFNLENDKDVATVRLCHKDANDIEIIACHQIEVDGRRKKVSCLRSYNDPISLCPLCAAGYPLQLRYFVHMLQYEKSFDGFTGAKEKKVWERGRTFQKEILGLSGRYNPLWQTAFEIERQGKKGEQTTKYGIYPMNYTTEELPIDDEDLENESVLGTIVMEKSAEELEYFVRNNEFPEGSNASSNSSDNDSPFIDDNKPAVTRREVPSAMSGSRRRI